MYGSEENPCFFPLPLRGRGNKISRNRKGRPSPQIPSESEGTPEKKRALCPTEIACNFRGTACSFFFSLSPENSMEFSGDPGILEKIAGAPISARLYSPKESKEIFSNSFAIRENGSLPIPGPLRFFWNLRGRLFFRFTCFFPLPRRGRGKKHVNRKERQDFLAEPSMAKPNVQILWICLFPRPATRISLLSPRSPENRMRFSGDKSKLHAIGSPPNGFAGACLRGIRQIRDRSENRMRFSERSSNLDVRLLPKKLEIIC